MSLSIIIPTLNEEAALPATLKSVAALTPAPLEVIVVDSSSQDRTVDIARAYGARVITGLPPGRAGQMNAGARIASGDQLCFLHADTELPADFVSLANGVLSDPRTALAGFISIMRGDNGVRRITTAHNFLKTWYAPLLFRTISFFRGARLLFGDQVMFCRRQDFWACGGFDAGQMIMEEADLCIRLSQLGRIIQVNRIVLSSDRRVAKWGVLKANFIYLAIGFLWGLGVSDSTLQRFYEAVR